MLNSGFYHTTALRVRAEQQRFIVKNCEPHPFKIDLNKKLDPKQITIQTFNIDAQRFWKIKNENSLTWEIKVAT